MSIYCDVYPYNKLPAKSQVEKMYEIGLKFVPGFYRDGDDARLGFSLRTFGVDQEMRFAVSEEVCRQQAPAIWQRLGQPGQMAFQVAYLNSGIDYLHTVLKNLENLGLDAAESYRLLEAFKKQVAEKIAETI